MILRELLDTPISLRVRTHFKGSGVISVMVSHTEKTSAKFLAGKLFDFQRFLRIEIFIHGCLHFELIRILLIASYGLTVQSLS